MNSAVGGFGQPPLDLPWTGMSEPPKERSSVHRFPRLKVEQITTLGGIGHVALQRPLAYHRHTA